MIPTPLPTNDVAFDAIILVGGTGSRLGGVDKAAVELRGRPLVAGPLRAATDARTLVVVGTTGAPLPPRAVVTRERPAGGGPAAALAAGLEAVDAPAPWTLLLACDLPGASDVVRALLTAYHSTSPSSAPSVDGYVLQDPDGRPQWVAGLYRTSAARRRVDEVGATAGGSLGRLLRPLALRPVEARAGEWRDVDTWSDHEHWVRQLQNEA